MPQMAPIWWSTLFITFILIFMAVMMMIYFFNILTLTNMKPKKSIEVKENFWKW